MLVSDVTLYSSTIDLSARLSASSGTHYSNFLEPHTQCHYDGYVPKKPWRALTQNECEKLIDHSPPAHHANSIGVGKIPPDILLLAGKLNINAQQVQQYHPQDYSITQYKHFEQALLAYCQLHCIQVEGMLPLPIYCGKRNLATSTFDYHKKQFIGLHYDNWDEASWTQRATARNRICVNLGIEERYFLFINLALKTVLQKLKPIEQQSYPLNEGPYRPFFSAFSDYPVVRLRLEPGEYYIAPTENIMHDGCTENKVYNDIVVTVLGHFHTRGLETH